MACVMQEYTVLDADGNFNLSFYFDTFVKTEKWVQNIALKIGAKCTKIKIPKGTNLCETAFLYQKCFKQADPVVSNTFLNITAILFYSFTTLVLSMQYRKYQIHRVSSGIERHRD